MIKKTVIKIILGILSVTLVLWVTSYFFYFSNPLRIYEANLLKWIPVLISAIGLYISGLINKDTSLKLLPLLFTPFIFFKLFGFLYFPFIFINCRSSSHSSYKKK